MNKLYKFGANEICVENHGWITPKQFDVLQKELDQKWYNRTDKIPEGQKMWQYRIDNGFTLKTISLAMDYVNTEDNTVGTEDFSIDRWNTLNLKHYSPEVRSFKQGKGQKMVADKIIDCGCFYGIRKNISRFIEKKYAEELATGYKITW